jgi:four helix bundle protein
MDLVQDVYSITEQLPNRETFGLVTQLQRASVSVPSNIAEGSKRSGKADFRKFCSIALGSAAELETQLIIVQRLYPDISVGKTINRLIEVQKMLSGLISKLPSKN